MQSEPQSGEWRGDSKCTSSEVRLLEKELESGEAIAAATRFYRAVASLPERDLGAQAGAAMRPVWAELAWQLESFNPVFAAVILKCQLTLGHTGYHERDDALQGLMQPLAGEYGLMAGRPLGASHRRLFADFYASVAGGASLPLDQLLRVGPEPRAAKSLSDAMMRDVLSAGVRGDEATALEQAAYALGYNLAVEFVASRLSRMALESWRALEARHGLQGLDWRFLETHAEGEAGHAEVGHAAATALVPRSLLGVMRAGMLDHDRDFAEFNHRLADMLDGRSP